MKKIRLIVMILTVAAMLITWPVHPIRKVQSQRSGDIGHVISEPLEVGDQIVQYFRSTDNNMIMLEFVVDYDAAAERSGHLLFELLNYDEEVIYSEILDYSALPDYTYTGVIINQKLKWGRKYGYRLTNIDIEDNQPCAVYTVDNDEMELWSGTLTVSGEEVSGEALTRITTNSPLPWADRLSIWGCIGIVGFTLSEMISRWGKNKPAKRNEV